MLISVGFTRPRPSCRSTTTSWGKKEQSPRRLFPFCFARGWFVHLHPCSTKSKLFNVWNLKCPLTTFLCVIRKFHGHSSLKEYYEKESCVHYIHNVRASIWVYSHCFSPVFLSLCVCVCVITIPFFYQVKVPLLLVNSADDPLVHDSLLAIPRTLAGN